MRRVIGCGIIALICCAAFAEQRIAGLAFNETSTQPAVGDAVVLLRLGKEQARTHTDAKGRFWFALPDEGAHYSVVVMHAGVNYELPVSDTVMKVSVFDAAAHIAGLSGAIGIAQVESNGKTARVTEMYSLTNNSKRTKTGTGYEITLDRGAMLDLFKVKHGDGDWVDIPAREVIGQPGRYDAEFAIPPGETLVKFAYHLPQRATTTLHLKLQYPIGNFAVVHPPSIAFAATSGGFSSPGVINGLQVEQANMQPIVGNVPAFTISGSGIAPMQNASGRATVPMTRAKAVSAPPIQPPRTRGKPAVASMMALGVLTFFGAILFAWRKKGVQASAPTIDALKDKLFQLEKECLHGAISAEQYAATKKAMESNVKQAIARSAR